MASAFAPRRPRTKAGAFPKRVEAAPAEGGASPTPDPPDPLRGQELRLLRFQKLRELGLTEYQAKAYLALLRLGRGTAAELARVTDVPRNKLYPVMQQLNQLGIVETAVGEAQVFRPLPLDRFVEDRLEAMRTQVRELDESRGALEALFRPPAEAAEATPGGYRVYHGRANTVEQLRQALKAARAEVVLVASPGAPRRMLASGEAEQLRARLEAGVRGLVVVPLLDDNHADAEQLGDLLDGAVVFTEEPTAPCTLLAVDGARACQAQTQPDDASATRGSDVCLVSASPILARVIEGYARALAAPGSPRLPWPDTAPEAPSPEPP